MLTTIQQKKVMIKKHPVLIRYFFKKKLEQNEKNKPVLSLKIERKWRNELLFRR
jgi:hypothetical protein